MSDDFGALCGECGGRLVEHRCEDCGTRHNGPPDEPEGPIMSVDLEQDGAMRPYWLSWYSSEPHGSSFGDMQCTCDCDGSECSPIVAVGAAGVCPACGETQRLDRTGHLVSHAGRHV